MQLETIRHHRETPKMLNTCWAPAPAPEMKRVLSPEGSRHHDSGDRGGHSGPRKGWADTGEGASGSGHFDIFAPTGPFQVMQLNVC